MQLTPPSKKRFKQKMHFFFNRSHQLVLLHEWWSHFRPKPLISNLAGFFFENWKVFRIGLKFSSAWKFWKEFFFCRRKKIRQVLKRSDFFRFLDHSAAGQSYKNKKFEYFCFCCIERSLFEFLSGSSERWNRKFRSNYNKKLSGKF